MSGLSAYPAVMTGLKHCVARPPKPDANEKSGGAAAC
jgi:hypothetical protein